MPAQRERRPWQPQEDELLRNAVAREDPSDNPSKWYAIAKHVPNRTNKDCRKRWFAKMASDVTKGGWSPDEDERLKNAIEKYGTRWSHVSAMVGTRNSDQCSKRWCDTLDPTIDRSAWSPENDKLLLEAVKEHGKVWTKIVKTYFPGRTGLAAKNRYNSITRFSNGSTSRSSTPASQQTRSSLDSTISSPSTPPENYQPLQPPQQFTFDDSDSYSTPSPYSTSSLTLQPMNDDAMLFPGYNYEPHPSYHNYPLPSPSGVPYISHPTRRETLPYQSEQAYYKSSDAHSNVSYIDRSYYELNPPAFGSDVRW